MSKLAAITLLAASILALAQVNPERIRPEVASRNLTKKVDPTVPPLAKAAGIGGTVAVDITIDASGKVISVALISGHPMLAPAFIETVKKWEYTPFVEDGRTIPVITRVEWTVVSPNYTAAQKKALDDYYPKFRSCYDLLKRGNELDAEQQCREALALADQLPKNRVLERSDARVFLGHCLYRQHKFADSIPLYEKAIEIRKPYEHSESDADFASENASLARAYGAVGRLSDSDHYYSESITIFRAAIIALPSMKENYTARLKSTLLEYAKLKAALGQNEEASELEKEAAQL
jgi:TonB family protein